MIPRVVSFLVLVAIVLLIGSMFFQVMVQFVVPLFLAAVMVVVFRPLHEWFLRRCGGREKLSAALTTLSILLIVMLPIAVILIRAIPEGRELFDRLSGGEFDALVGGFANWISPWAERVGITTAGMEQELTSQIVPVIRQWAGPLAVKGATYLIGALFGAAIMVISIYYFFVDGPAMIVTLMRLSPLDDAYERQLLDRFADLSRAVVIATLLSAFVQGVLAGIGYYLALPAKAPLFFLTALTMLFAMVPFVGSAAVWIPTCLIVYVNELGNPDDNRTWAAVILAIYCGLVVSNADNVIKPVVLHGRSNLHPLLALLSVIGGVQVLGPIGILVGPMLVAFFQALLDMLRKELEDMGTTLPSLAAAGQAMNDTDRGTAAAHAASTTSSTTSEQPPATLPIDDGATPPSV